MPLGKALLDAEVPIMDRLVPSRYYPVMLQAHGPRKLNLKALDMARSQYWMTWPSEVNASGSLFADVEHLPFGANSIDLLVLPHVLEFTHSPHNTLREIVQCVAPEGVVAITGFNPQSMFGISKYLRRFAGSIIDGAQLYSSVRVRDWLALLGFDVIAGEFAFFRPPLLQEKKLSKLRHLETAGMRWWPAMGAIYVIVAQNKEFGMNMAGAHADKTFQSRQRVLRPVAERARQSARLAAGADPTSSTCQSR